jgi:hypothetical protein
MQIDIKRLQELVQAASEEAISRGLDVPAEVMTERIVKALDHGLRDPDTLKAVALGDEVWPPTGTSGQGPLIDPATLGTRS